ncbi:MAG: hypothetical protein L0387_03895, partial [Acidobacteria bacterium]|nr:hypothetical protein [Acidobacteriota bacterium]
CRRNSGGYAALRFGIVDSSFPKDEVSTKRGQLQPLNPNPICVSFSQMFLFPKGDRGKGLFDSPRYLIGPASFGFNTPLDEKEEVALATELLQSLLSAIPINADISTGKIPDPDKNGNLIAKKSVLVAKGFVSEKLHLSDGELETVYKDFVKNSQEQQLGQINNVAKTSGVRFTIQDVLTPNSNDAIAKARQWLFPGFFQHFSTRHPKVALVAKYQQCWEPVGYTRGDLVNSFSLAPGEELTLEYHYWDKSTVKSEEELASETESKVTNTLTQRDSRELLSELFSEHGTKVDGGVNLTIPIPAGEVPIPVGVDFNSDIAIKVGTKLSATAKSSTDQVVEASNTFKQTHRVRVEITRESGSENKQTRVIANTNRCHTLNCVYFEVLSNYLVSVGLVGIEPCLLVQFDTPKITREFILCHEHVLKRVLLDRLFLAGFEAAKKLRANFFLKLLKKARERAEARRSEQSTGSPTQFTTPDDPTERRFRGLVSNIVRDFNQVKGDAEDVLNGLGDVEPLDLDIVSFVTSVGLKLRRLLYWAVLNLNTKAVDALNNLKEAQSASVPSQEALADFFALVTSRDYEDNVVVATVENALDSLGIPRLIVDALMGAHRLNAFALADDDAGLAASVRAAEEAFANALPPVTLPGATTPVPGQAGPTQSAAVDEFSLLELAEATVELERLGCHIKENKSHYLQAIFQSIHPDQRLEILRAKGLDGIVRNEIVGFFNDHALLPLVDMSLFVDLLKASTKMKVSVEDLAKFMKDITETIDKAGKPRLVTIPTPATLMEATVGECDACEDYIQKSRLLDLRQQEAKARAETAEASRREQRLASQPPDLSDPVDHSPARIVVDLNTNRQP